MFVNMGTFDILALPEASLPDPVGAAAAYRAWGMDYIISGNLRAGPEGAENRLILRVLDARRGESSFGDALRFPRSGPDTAKTAFWRLPRR